MVDWSRVRFTEHMTEAAAVVGECHVVLDFGAGEPIAYEVKVYHALKGASDEAYFAVGMRRDDPGGYRASGAGATAEDAVQGCLEAAGIHHRRKVKQATE